MSMGNSDCLAYIAYVVPENNSCGVGEAQNVQSAGNVMAVRQESIMFRSMRARTGESATAPQCLQKAPMDLEIGSRGFPPLLCDRLVPLLFRGEAEGSQ